MKLATTTSDNQKIFRGPFRWVKDGFYPTNAPLAAQQILRFFIIGLAFILIACTTSEQSTPLTELRIGVLPDQSEAELHRRYTPLFEFIAQEVGLSYRLIVPKNYEDLSELFRKKEIDLAYFGGFTFIKANKRSGAIPVVMRDVDTRFTSLFFTNGASQAKDLSEFKGKIFSFGSELSTSGHLMPRFFMETEKSIVPEDYFASVHYSGKHDRTAYMVRDGEVDLGVANALIIQTMLTDGRLKPGDVKILWKTPPYPDYVWTMRAGINNADWKKIRQAFLKLSADDKHHAAILAGVDAGGFIPADIADFSQLQAIVKDMKLLD